MGTKASSLHRDLWTVCLAALAMVLLGCPLCCARPITSGKVTDVLGESEVHQSPPSGEGSLFSASDPPLCFQSSRDSPIQTSGYCNSFLPLSRSPDHPNLPSFPSSIKRPDPNRPDSSGLLNYRTPLFHKTPIVEKPLPPSFHRLPRNSMVPPSGVPSDLEPPLPRSIGRNTHSALLRSLSLDTICPPSRVLVKPLRPFPAKSLTIQGASCCNNTGPTERAN